MRPGDKKKAASVDGGALADNTWLTRLVSTLLGRSSRQCAPEGGGLRFRACEKCARSVGVVNVVVSSLLMVLKGYLGVVGGSSALVADAVHSGIDVLASVTMVFGLKIAGRRADSKYPYGYGKVEFFVAVIIHVALVSAGLVILKNAVCCIINRAEVSPSIVTLLGALISIVVCEMVFRQSVCAGTQLSSPSMVANAWEKRSDVLTSIAVFLGIAGAMAGWHFLDPLAAVVVGLYIVKFSIGMIIESFKGLLDQALAADVVGKIRASAEQVDGVMSVAALRTREIGQMVCIDVEILVDGSLQVDEVIETRREVQRAIARQINRPASIAVYMKPAPVRGQAQVPDEGGD